MSRLSASSARFAVAGAAALVAVSAGWGCDPADEPVTTTAPPRDPDLVEVRTIATRGDSIQTLTFQQDATLNLSDRVYFGSWNGAEARAFVEFDFSAADSLPTVDGTVTSAVFRFNCVDGQGPVDGLMVEVVQVTASDVIWTDEDPAWPGPALDEGVAELSTIDRCPDLPDTSEPAYDEIELAAPIEMVDAWLTAHFDEADSTTNRGLAIRTAADAGVLSMASRENLFFANEVDPTATIPRPRIVFVVSDTTYSVNAIVEDAYAVAPDAATVPCADPADCLQIGKGAAWRSLFLFELPELPQGANVHRAILRLHVLGHPRFDDDLVIDAIDLTSEWPTGAPVDSLVETSGIIWSKTDVGVDSTSVDVPLTNLVQAWFDGTIDNQGILLRTEAVDEGFTAVSFGSSTHPNEALRPELEIKYTVPYGGRP